jgi:hypothetical protein
MAECKSCRANVRWVTLQPSGKRNPIDPSPAPTGNIKLVGVNDWTQEAVVLSGLTLDQARANGTPLYLSHFATCPNAKQHRAKR